MTARTVWRRLVPLLVIGLLLGWGVRRCHLWIFPEVSTQEWDKRLDAMCAQRFQPDRAYKVFERVPLPPGYISDKDGQLKVIPSEGSPPDRYPIVERLVEREIIREDRPRISMYAAEYYRQSDGKVIGEWYFFARAGVAAPFAAGYLNRHLCPSDNSTFNFLLDLFEGLREDQLGRNKK